MRSTRRSSRRSQFVKKLAEARSPEPPLTIVLGASGTGESSLVKAGLLSYLRQPASRVADPAADPAGQVAAGFPGESDTARSRH